MGRFHAAIGTALGGEVVVDAWLPRITARLRFLRLVRRDAVDPSSRAVGAMVSITRAALVAGIAATAVALAPQPRVVVTGLGAVTGIGNTYEAMWSSLLEGATGIAKVSCFEDVERFGSHVGCEVRDFEGKEWFASPKSANSNDRYTHLAMAAARQAVEDAQLHIDESEGGATHPERVGVMIGSAFGGIGTVESEMARMEKRGPRKVSPFAIPALLGNTASGVVAIELNARGPNFGVVSACASGTHAIGEGGGCEIQRLRSRPFPTRFG